MRPTASPDPCHLSYFHLTPTRPARARPPSPVRRARTHARTLAVALAVTCRDAQLPHRLCQGDALRRATAALDGSVGYNRRRDMRSLSSASMRGTADVISHTLALQEGVRTHARRHMRVRACARADKCPHAQTHSWRAQTRTAHARARTHAPAHAWMRAHGRMSVPALRAAFIDSPGGASSPTHLTAIQLYGPWSPIGQLVIIYNHASKAHSWLPIIHRCNRPMISKQPGSGRYVTCGGFAASLCVCARSRTHRTRWCRCGCS